MPKQFLRSALLVLLITALLAACTTPPAGEQGGDAPAGDVAPEDITGTVRFYKGPFGPDEAQQYAELITKFNEEFPNIEVIHEMYDWPTQEAQVTAALAGGTHDVIYVAEGYYPKFAYEGGPLTDLDTFVEEPAFQEQREDILYWDIAESPDGVLGGVPYVWITESLFMVNDDLLEQAGVPDDWNDTLEGVHEAARAIDALGEDIHGIAWRSPAGEEGAQYDWYGYILRSGADYLNEDQTGCGLDTPEMVETFNILKAMQDEGLTPEYGAYGWDGLRGLFQGGKIGIMHDEQPLAGVLASNPPGFNYHFENIPGLANDNMLTFRGFLVVPEASENKAAAWEWIKFLTRAENETWYFNRTTGLYPAVASVTAEEVFPDNPVLSEAVNMAQYAQGPLFHPQALEFQHIVQPHIDEFFAGDITAEEMISQSCEQIEATLQQ